MGEGDWGCVMPDSIFRCRQLVETRDKELLISSFPWGAIPPSFEHWESIFLGTSPLTESDILLIEEFILDETFTTP